MYVEDQIFFYFLDIQCIGSKIADRWFRRYFLKKKFTNKFSSEIASKFKFGKLKSRKRKKTII